MPSSNTSHFMEAGMGFSSQKRVSIATKAALLKPDQHRTPHKVEGNPKNRKSSSERKQKSHDYPGIRPSNYNQISMLIILVRSGIISHIWKTLVGSTWCWGLGVKGEHACGCLGGVLKYSCLAFFCIIPLQELCFSSVNE